MTAQPGHTFLHYLAIALVLLLAVSLPRAVAFPVNDRFAWDLVPHAGSELSAGYRAMHMSILFQKRPIGSDCKDIGLYVNDDYKLTDKLSADGGIRDEMPASELRAALGPAAVNFGRGYARDLQWIGGGHILGLNKSMSGGGHSMIPFGVDCASSNIKQTQHSLIVGFEW